MRPAVYAAILAPSGRVAHDVHLHRELGAGGASGGGAVLADLPAATFDAAVSLLRKMRLRARVTLDDAGDDLAVVVRADDDRAAPRAIAAYPGYTVRAQAQCGAACRSRGAAPRPRRDGRRATAAGLLVVATRAGCAAHFICGAA